MIVYCRVLLGITELVSTILLAITAFCIFARFPGFWLFNWGFCVLARKWMINFYDVFSIQNWMWEWWGCPKEE